MRDTRLRRFLNVMRFSYEQRAQALETIVQNYKEPTSFEEFASKVLAPAPAKSPLQLRRSGEPLPHPCAHFACNTQLCIDLLHLRMSLDWPASIGEMKELACLDPFVRYSSLVDHNVWKRISSKHWMPLCDSHKAFFPVLSVNFVFSLSHTSLFSKALLSLAVVRKS